MKTLIALMLFTTLSASAASITIEVDVDGAPKSGRVYFNYSTNSHNGNDYIHLDQLRVRVGREGFSVAARTDIDSHICQLLGYSDVDYRVIGGGLENATANIMRVNGRNVIVPIDYDSRVVSQHFSLDSMSCVRPL